MDRKPQPPRNPFTITPINAPTFADAQSARELDTFKGIAVTTSVPNVNSGDQDIPPPIFLINKKGIINSGKKNGKKHRLSGKLLTKRLMKKRRNL